MVEMFKNIFEKNLLEEVENNGLKKSYASGEVILEVGKTIRMMPLIVKGTIKVSRIDDNSNEVLLYYVNPLESCSMTFTCCMQAKKSEIRAVAEEDVELLMLPNHFMDDWMNKYPTWKSFVMNTIQSRFEELLHVVDQIAFKKLDERLIDYLNEKVKVSGSTLLNLSHLEISRDLATSRVVISRLLKQLENQNKLLLYRNQIKILLSL